MKKEDSIALLEEIAELMKLKGENPFKVRAFEKAALSLASIQEDAELIDRANAGTLTEIEGVGKGISEVLTEFLKTGKSAVIEELKSSFTPIFLEVVKLPGVGPKKAKILMEYLEITNLADLEYACRENRVLQLKGFGDKAQARILEGIEFKKKNQGKLRLDEALQWRDRFLIAAMQMEMVLFFESGSLAQCAEVVEAISLVAIVEGAVADSKPGDVIQWAKAWGVQQGCPIPIWVEAVMQDDFKAWTLKDWMQRRYSKTFVDVISKSKMKSIPFTLTSHFENNLQKNDSNFITKEQLDSFENALLVESGFSYVPVEASENAASISFLQKKKSASKFEWNQTPKGFFHFHTTRSDGLNSLEEMILAAKSRGFSYLGVSDHSQSAFYARGLKKEDLLEQEKEVRLLQKKYPDIRIFWGIESDILADGSLDYDSKTLSKFDFVIASIHSRFQMDKTTMTRRVVEALKNPYTTFLGHPTGRLLLGRSGYELDWSEICKVASDYDVAIELNAHPARLDVDWRIGELLLKNENRIGIHPDAHEVAGIDDVRYGVWMANKALIPASQVVNAMPKGDVEAWLGSRKKI